MKKVLNTIKGWRNDGTDPRKNDAWRVLLFALNHSSSVALTNLTGKWSYYTQNVLKLGLFLTSAAIVTTIVDAVVDPFLAIAFDRFESRYGKYKPFMLAGSILSIIPVLVIFCYPVDPPIPVAASYAILLTMNGIKAVGTSITATVTNAGQAVITQDPKQRPLYSLGQTAFDAVVMLFTSLVITGDTIGRMQDTFVWRVAALVLSLTSAVLNIISMVAISNRDNKTYYKISEKREKPKITEFWYLMKRSKPFRCLLIATASDSVAASVRANFSIYLFANIIMHRSLVSTFDIVSGSILGIPVLLFGIFFASNKGTAVIYSKLSIWQAIIPVAGFAFCAVFLPCNPAYEYTGLSFAIIMVLLFYGAYKSSLGISSNLVKAMVGDLTDYEYYEHGSFIPGTISAAMSFMTTIFGSFVGIFVSMIMVFCGLGEAGTAVPENIFINERFYYCVLGANFLIPALGHLITWFSMKRYPLTKEKMEEVSLFIAKKRGVLKEEAEGVFADEERLTDETGTETGESSTL